MDVVLEHGSVTDQMQPIAGELTLRWHGRIGQPDRRHQVASRQLGQHPGIDAVGLAGQRRQALDLLSIGDLDVPAEHLQGVVDEAGAVHRFDRGTHGPEGCQLANQHAQPIRVGSSGRGSQVGPILREDADIKTGSTQVETDVHHILGPPW